MITTAPGNTSASLAFARALWRWPRRVGMQLWPRRRVHARGLTFTLPCENDVTYSRWRSFNEKEPETLDWIDRVMTDGDVFVDVGANIGLYTLYAAVRHPRSRIVALEPEYANLHVLRDNVALNGLSDRVDIFAVAVSDRSRLSYLHVSDLRAGAALHSESPQRIAAAAEGGQAVCREGVYGQTLDDFCAETGIDPNCMKIDVDGNEAKVLAGAAAILRRPALRSVLIELPNDTDSRADCESRLRRAGLGPESAVALQRPGNSAWNRLDNTGAI